MADQTERPRIAAPLIENIPAELRERYQWIVWRYEWRINKQDIGKWTKVPYTPGTTSKAMPNKESTWRSFKAAHNCYLERPDFFDGIGYMFLKTDPYVGGDRDHSLDLEGIPPTYTEVSPSGQGVKFIARVNGHYSRHTVKGELYSSGRFFTITGNVIAGREHITACQNAVDQFLASLGGIERKNSTYTSNGSRSQLAAAVPAEDWAEGRRLLRDDLNKLLARLRGSAAPKTQLFFVIRNDYNGLHTLYPSAGAIRADGSIDSSQIRAIFANGMRMRGFAFPEFVALFYHFYGADCLAKWGTTQGFREEAATLWAKARTGTVAQPPIEPARRGTLLERTYQILLNYKAGISAIVMLDDIARDLGVQHRATVSRAIKALTKENKITTRRHGSHGGLIVEFLPELIYENGIELTNAENNGSPSVKIEEAKDSSELIYGIAIGDTEAVNHVRQSAKIETNNSPSELIYGETETAYESANTPEEVREKEPPHIDRVLYKSTTVFLPGFGNSQKCDLRQAVTAAFDELPKNRTNEYTGELKRWAVTNERIIAYVQEHYAAFGWKPAAIEDWADRIRKQRKAETFRELKGMKRTDLEKRAGSVRKRMARFEDKAKAESMPKLGEWYQKQANLLSGQLALIAWELQRRDSLDDQRIEQNGYSAGEQQEMLELVQREYKLKERPTQTVSLPTRANTAASLIARLQARKRQDE